MIGANAEGTDGAEVILKGRAGAAGTKGAAIGLRLI